jgi:hypothetical protein
VECAIAGGLANAEAHGSLQNTMRIHLVHGKKRHQTWRILTIIRSENMRAIHAEKTVEALAENLQGRERAAEAARKSCGNHAEIHGN